MDLKNLLPHKRNTQVSVNGTVYKIDANGLCPNVAPADATKLLQNKGAWTTRLVGADGKAMTPRSPMQLIGMDGKPIAREMPPTPAAPPPALIVVPSLDEVVQAGYSLPVAHGIVASQAALAAGKSPAEASMIGIITTSDFLRTQILLQEKAAPPPPNKEAGPPPVPAATTESASATPGEIVWKVPAEGGEWPDPTEEMPLDYLLEMAKAYQVKITKTLSKDKSKLVETLNEVMFAAEE